MMHSNDAHVDPQVRYEQVRRACSPGLGGQVRTGDPVVK